MASKPWEIFEQPSIFPKRITVPYFRGNQSLWSLPYKKSPSALKKQVEVQSDRAEQAPAAAPDSEDNSK
jgi:hypothetical protein